jgi:hypothetical protein
MAKSRSLESRSPVARGAKKFISTLEFTVWHIVSATFILTFLLTWAVMQTMQPGLFFTDEDFLESMNTAAAAGSGAEARDNKVFSDKGRYAAFLWSFVVALLISFAVFLFYRMRK